MREPALHLTFHGLGPGPAGEPAAAARYRLPFSALDATIAAISASKTPVRLHFDDGEASDRLAAERLAEAGLTATFHVLAGRIGAPGSLGASDLSAMVALGMRIGSHGFDHVPWTGLDAAALRRETVEARNAIEDLIGAPVVDCAAPFGAFDRRAVQAALAAGFRLVHTSSRGPDPGYGRLVPRTSVTADFEPARDVAVWSTGWTRAAARSFARRLVYGA